MNSLVLKPCRCVVFLMVIPLFAPSPSGLRRLRGLFSDLATAAVRPDDRRGACDPLRLARDGAFFTFRRTAGEVFLVRLRAFSATAFAWSARLSVTVPRKRPEKIRSQLGG